jgi:glucoamylase
MQASFSPFFDPPSSQAAANSGLFMKAQAGPGHFFPEQIWDAADIPGRELLNGHPSGSAMPSVWAHAEYIKFVRSLRDGRVFDLPPQTVKPHLTEKIVSPHMVWRFNHKIRS